MSSRLVNAGIASCLVGDVALEGQGFRDGRGLEVVVRDTTKGSSRIRLLDDSRVDSEVLGHACDVLLVEALDVGQDQGVTDAGGRVRQPRQGLKKGSDSGQGLRSESEGR